MANDLSALVPVIIARAALVLRGKLVMPRIVNSNYGSEVAEAGDTIDVPIPVSVGVTDVTPSNVPPAPASLTPKKVPVTLNQWKKTNGISVTDKEMHEVRVRRDYLPQQVEQAMVDLGTTVNSFLMSKYTAFYGHYGSPSTHPFNSTDKVKHATESRRVLAEQLCPDNPRFGVLDPVAEANALALDAFQRVNEAGDRGPKIDGMIGRKFGIEWVMDQAVPSHTTGAATAGSIAIDNGAGYSAGDETIHIDGLTADPVVGDIFTRANGDQHVVKSVSGTGAELDITIAPALKSAALDDEALTFVASHRANLLFHPSAFAFGMRPLGRGMSTQGGNIISNVTDPETGLSLRLEISRQYKQTVWEFDILYGAEVVRPELGMRILGQP